MRVVVVGASGNVGTAVLRRLAEEPGVGTVTGVARRLPPRGVFAGVDWRSIDVGAPDGVEALARCFAGADVVIQLAWQIQPSHDQARLRRTNVTGNAQVAAAVVRAGTPALVVASSVGVYAPGPKDREVDEDWPATGVPGSTYSRDKVEVEALLDDVERANPALRLVRLRPGLVFQRSAASEIARLFIGPLAPLSLLGFGRLPIVPAVRGLRVQAVHADDVADAYVRAALSTTSGPFNIAAGPVLDAASVAERFHGRQVPLPARLLPAAAAATWRARLQPVEPGWVELALRCPLLSSDRAHKELGWQPDRRDGRARGALPGHGRPGRRPHPPAADAAGRHRPTGGDGQRPASRPRRPLLSPEFEGGRTVAANGQSAGVVSFSWRPAVRSCLSTNGATSCTTNRIGRGARRRSRRPGPVESTKDTCHKLTITAGGRRVRMVSSRTSRSASLTAMSSSPRRSEGSSGESTKKTKGFRDKLTGL